MNFGKHLPAAGHKLARRCSISALCTGRPTDQTCSPTPQHQGIVFCHFSSDAGSLQNMKQNSEEFRVLNLRHKKSEKAPRRKPWVAEIKPPRSTQMPVDQDWPSVWPGPRSFHPASVPLPLRQGYTKKGAPPGKYANAELMKIPNFLHLTPPAIKQQCRALKQFCTTWPSEVDTDEKCRKYFPIEVISSDYVHSAPVIRNPLSRIVSVKLGLCSLPLDAHAKDKMLRLVGERYNSTTDEITITVERCPLRQQNYDFAMYVLTALFHESWKVEPWESEKSEADMEYYDWDKSISRNTVINLMNWPGTDSQDISVLDSSHLVEYKQAVSELFNMGEDQFAIEKYKEKTKKLLFKMEPNLMQSVQ